MSREGDPADRRRFFRLGVERLRQGVVDAARELSRVSETVAEAAEEASREGGAEGVPFHRDRRRGGQGEAAATRGPRAIVRPPGALPEPEFLSACTRCRDCVEACPEGSIVRASPSLGPSLELTPILIVDQKPCYLCTDVPCAAACTTGALEPVAPEDIRLGTAVVMGSLCLEARGHACDACVVSCPFPGEAIARGPERIPVVNADACTGCGLCVKSCRAYPKALRVEPA